MPITTETLFPGHHPIPADIQAYIRNHPQTTWFHLQSLNGCILLPDRFVPILFIVREKGTITGAISAIHMLNQGSPSNNRLTSRIQSNGSPLLKEVPGQTGSMLLPLLELARRYSGDNASVLEFRNTTDTSPWLKTWLNAGFSRQDHLNLVKSINSEEQLWQELGENRRRQIRRATANGTTVRPAASETEIHNLYNILHQLYTTKVLKILPPVEFFLDFYKNCQPHGKGVVLVALLNDQVIGGIVCPIHSTNTMYEWYVCGKDKEHPHNHPSVMATWHALQYALQHGIQTFDFMGLGKPGIPYGVRDFKLRFGGEVVNYGRYVCMFGR